jgi:hypothetical protein
LSYDTDSSLVYCSLIYERSFVENLININMVIKKVVLFLLKKGLEIFEMQGNDSKRYTSQVVV